MNDVDAVALDINTIAVGWNASDASHIDQRVRDIVSTHQSVALADMDFDLAVRVSGCEISIL